MAVIEVEGLTKSFGDNHAVRGLTFSVAEGEVLAVLGPNGAGKTTTVEILEGYQERDGGSASVLGMDPATGGSELRQRIGIVLQECGVELDLTVAEVLAMYGRYYPRQLAVDDVIRIVELDAKATDEVWILANNHPIARGEIQINDDRIAIAVTREADVYDYMAGAS